LVAFLDESDHHHLWACRMVPDLAAPLLTCEAVLAEACHLLRSVPEAHDRIMEMILTGAIAVQPMLPSETSPIRALLTRYRDRGIDLADACIIRLSELHAGCRVVTTDLRDFRVYRSHGRKAISLICPAGK
jgi:predicted nucleic acid-binding protein